MLFLTRPSLKHYFNGRSGWFFRVLRSQLLSPGMAREPQIKRLLMLSLISAFVASPAPAAETKAKTVVDVAVETGQSGTLISVLKAAGLVGTRSGPGPFAVSAPTGAAFAKISKASLAALLADKAKLAPVPTYHVVSRKVMAADAVKLASAKSVARPEIKNAAGKDVALKGTSKVTKTNVVASTGVTQVIDTVLMTPGDTKPN